MVQTQLSFDRALGSIYRAPLNSIYFSYYPSQQSKTESN